MRAVIHIRDLESLCVLGVRAHERVAAQRVRFDLDVGYEEPPGEDTLDAALDYSAISELVMSTAQRGRFRLAERLAEACCRSVLESFARAAWVRVTVKKPAARAEAAWVGATVERARDEET